MFFNLSTEINSLRKKINRLLNKEMILIKLKKETGYEKK